MAESTNIIKRATNAVRDTVASFVMKSPKARAFFSMRSPFTRNLWVMNGEKTLGELGPERDYYVDFASYRSRGKQFALDNEVAQMIIKSMEEWVIGNGLQLECEPNELVLQSAGITIDIQKFSDQVEALIDVLKESRETSFSRMRNWSMEEARAFTQSNTGGAILVVLRVRNGIVCYELIDGAHLRHPAGGTDLNPTMLSGGFRIQNGIEMNEAGEHVAYWVVNANWQCQRIEARSPSTGLVMAFLYGGSDLYLDSSLTIPALGGLFQTLQQMDDYKTATLGSAKSQNSIAYQVKTEKGGDTVNPLGEVIERAMNFDPNSNIPHDNLGQAIANKVAAETGKNTFLLGEGQAIEPLEKNKAELYFEQFWRTLFECVCAASGMPPNVVLKRFDTSFSSARAAIKDWAHSLNLKRYKHGYTFNRPAYELQLHLFILTGQIQAPGYLSAFATGNTLVLGAYRQARWVGDNVPEIDELKEVNAVRAALGPAFDHVPLISPRKGTDSLGYQAFKVAIKDAGQDLQDAKANGIEPVVPVAPEGAKPTPDK